MSEKTQHQDWLNRRAAAVRARYSAYDALGEHGFGESIPDSSTPTQMPCPYHGADNRPSARYYPSDGRSADYVRCYKCKENWDAISLYSKFKGIKWYESLKDLERRFDIKLPKRPDGEEIKEPVQKTSSKYESEKWNDVLSVLPLLEKKLLRIREKSSLTEFIRFCRLIDIIKWDFEHNGNISTPEMVITLKKCYDKMNEVASRTEDDITL